MSLYDVFYFRHDGVRLNYFDSEVPDVYLTHLEEKGLSRPAAYAKAVDKTIPNRCLYLQTGGEWVESKSPPEWWIPGRTKEKEYKTKRIEFKGRRFTLPYIVPEWSPKADDILRIGTKLWPELCDENEWPYRYSPDADYEYQFYQELTEEFFNLVERFRDPGWRGRGRKWTYEQAIRLVEYVAEKGLGFRPDYDEAVKLVGPPMVES